MLTATQIAAIIMLLNAFGVDPITVRDVGHILNGNQTSIINNKTANMNTVKLTPDTSVTSAPSPIATKPQTVSYAEPASLARIEIINPFASKGSNVEHSTSSDFDERGNPMNEMDIAAIVHDKDGDPTSTDTVTVSTPDSSQDKKIVGTGAVTPMYKDGKQDLVPIYNFHYVFKSKGEHKIVFSANGISESITVIVTE